MRLASFNVENLFRRPKALNTVGWDTGERQLVLSAFGELQGIFEKHVYTEADKARILKLLDTLGVLKTDESQWVFLRRSRGQLVRRPRQGAVEVVANGRDDWIGWLELKREAVNEQATRNTARVIADVRADVLAVIEAEDRPALDRFNRDVLPFGFTDPKKAWTYRHVMLVDGNDDRGIDVGLFSRAPHPIQRIRSHVADRDGKGNTLFSRDCAEYEVHVPGGDPILVMVNHFKSKGHGTQAENNARRLAQATRVAKIYRERVKDGWKRIAVVGDLNDTPDSAPIKPLSTTDLEDVSTHPNFVSDGRTGTFGTTKDKIDYILLSPALFGQVTEARYNRSGVFHGPKVKNAWPMLEKLTKPLDQASDHAAVWADLNV
jgi:endonuclease/exonuclease/phosphatase family metal-dependent hydrolase